MATDGTNPSASPYTGRWIARVRGRIVAQADTRESALRAALAARPKEQPELVYLPPEMSFPFHPLIESIRPALPAGTPVHLVGGAVRDALLNRPCHDLDFAVPEGGRRIARAVADRLHAAYMSLDDERDTGRVVVIHEDGSRTYLDFATYRGGDLLDDLRKRDFTLNAIAVDVQTGEVLDPLGGAQDILARQIRACGPDALSDDPVRILRAIRQAAAFGFLIQPETRKLMRAAAPQLPRISPERLRDELFKMLAGARAEACVRAMQMLGVLPALLPELVAAQGVTQCPPHVHDVWEHTLAVMRHLDAILAVLAPGFQTGEDAESGDLLTGLLSLKLGRYRGQFAEHLAVPLNTDRDPRGTLFFAALYHDASKPQVRTVEKGRIRFLGHDEKGAEAAAGRAAAFHLSNDEIERIRAVIRNHMRVHQLSDAFIRDGKMPSRRAIYRFFNDCGPAGVDVVLLSLADTRATYEHNLTQEHWSACLDVCRALLESWWERREEAVAPPALLDGHDLMAELGLPPGKQLGMLIESIREGQAAGEIDSRESALAHARAWLSNPPEK
jgi:tRNA nucleotidyltransferase/poly(A) polymerase